MKNKEGLQKNVSHLENCEKVLFALNIPSRTSLPEMNKGITENAAKPPIADFPIQVRKYFLGNLIKIAMPNCSRFD